MPFDILARCALVVSVLLSLLLIFLAICTMQFDICAFIILAISVLVLLLLIYLIVFVMKNT